MQGRHSKTAALVAIGEEPCRSKRGGNHGFTLTLPKFAGTTDCTVEGMATKFPKSLWLIAAGIMLTAMTLRVAVTVVPPVISFINEDLPINATTVGVLGMLPTAAFAVFGFLTPYVVRWASPEKLVIVSLAVGVAGQVARVFAPNTAMFLVFSVVAYAGLGAGNVLLPPLVKKYFPTKVGLMTALYVTILNLGTALPAQFAVPVAVAAGWQISLVSWAGLSVVAMIPWLIMLITPKSATQVSNVAQVPASGSNVQISSSTPAVHKPLKMNLWKSPTAWGLTLMFGCTSLNTYSIFAWLPQILHGAGLDTAFAGSMLALFAFWGLPLSLLVPVIAVKMRNPFPMVIFTLACFVAGYIGLLLSPTNGTVLWVSLIGLGPGTFPLALVMINHRTRTQQGAGALSGFSQGIGYAIACAGPLFFGLLHEWTGSWTAPFVFLFCTLVFLGIGAAIVCRPRMLEDDFAPAK